MSLVNVAYNGSMIYTGDSDFTLNTKDTWLEGNIGVQVSVPTYSGSYSATPTNAEQTFPTAGMLMESDFTVGAASGGSDDNFKIAMGAMSGSIYDADTVSVPSYAFNYRSNLFGVEMLNCISIGEYAFASCQSLSFISFPRCASICNYAFYGCIALTGVIFPECVRIEAYAFNYCNNLSTAIFQKCRYIGSSAFYNCTALKSLYLLGSSVIAPSDMHTDAFYNTPISKSTYLGEFGSIYVPASLVGEYKATRGWSVYSNRITAYTG